MIPLHLTNAETRIAAAACAPGVGRACHRFTRPREMLTPTPTWTGARLARRMEKLSCLVRARNRAGAGYACSARPDLHTVCRSFPKICDGARRGLGHVWVGRPDPACLQHMQRGPHARSSCRRWLCLQRSPRISTPPSAAHLLNAHQLFVQNFAADRDRQHDLQSRQRSVRGACPCG